MQIAAMFRHAGIAVLAASVSFAAAAHHLPDPLEATPTAAAQGAPLETQAGHVLRVTIDDRVAGVVLETYSLRLDDGRGIALKGDLAAGLQTGERIEVTGRRNGKAFFTTGLRRVAGPPPRGATSQKARRAELKGRLALLHVDHFDEERSEFVFEVHDAAGNAVPLALPALPEALQKDMQVSVAGETNADGSVVPDTITILALPSDAKAVVAKALKTNTVLVILMSFTDSPPLPFTQAQVQSVFAGGPGSGSVTEYFKEVSFGQQVLNPTITPWLPTNSATPAGCNYQSMATLGRNAANAAGYNVSGYQNVVYVFPQVSGCGWIGLAYVGAPGVWINGRNQISPYTHELGHNFGLLHAGSLRCGTNVIGGSCSVSEYGDPFGSMGNQTAMHYNAKQKLGLGWIPSGSVVTHATGTVTYTLSPIELGGQTTYAVKVPAASNRTYWLEYRQPIGFDAGMASYPNNGVQVRVGNPFETMCSGCDAWSNDTQLLDMTPATGSFTDAALVAGKSFTDSTYGVTFNVVGATSTAVTVQVTTGGSPPPPPPAPAATTTTASSSANPAAPGAAVTFTATVTGASPTGTVAFADNGKAISGCSAAALAGAGNTRTATCTTSQLAAGTHSIVATYSGNASNNGSSSPALSQVINTPPPATAGAWFDDAVPSGATLAGTSEGWSWVSNPAPFSGGLAHQSALLAGVHQHYFYGASATMSVVAGDTLYAYVYLDPANPPSEVMLQWFDGSWEHRAYWGANQIGWGTNNSSSRRYMGPLPATGQWVKLSVPAAQVGLEGRVVNGMAFTLYGGRATWDVAGRTAGGAASPTAGWIDDAVPAGAALAGTAESWNWVTTPTPYSGGLAHQSALVAGLHQHYFYGATATMSVVAGDTLYAYVYLDPLNPPSQVMLQWNDGSWEHRAYWGANQIGWGTNGTNSRRYMGPLPVSGQWVRLAVPASQVGLEGRVVNGMAFTLYNGRATWDVAGRTPSAGAISNWLDDMGASATPNLEAGRLPPWSRGRPAT